MPTTDQDLRALTYLARRLRDETHGCNRWDEAGTFAILKDTLSGQNLLLACQRVIGHAVDTDAKTPGAIKRPFVPAVEQQHRGDIPPRKHEECPRHVGQYRASCGGCRSDQLAATPYGHDDTPPDDTGWDAARIRAEIRTRTQPEETP